MSLVSTIQGKSALVSVVVVMAAAGIGASFLVSPFLALALGVVALVLPVFSKYRFQALLGLFFVAPFFGIAKAIFDTRLAPAVLDIGIVLLLIAGFFTAIADRKPMKLTLASLLALTLLGLSFGYIFHPGLPDLMLGLEGFRTFGFAILGFFLPAFFITKEKDLDTALKVILVSALVVALYGIKQFFLPTDIDRRVIEMSTSSAIVFGATGMGIPRAFSTMSGPFHFGIFMAFALVGAFALGKRQHLLPQIGAGLLYLSGILLSLTRTSLIAAVIGIGMVQFLRVKLSLKVLASLGGLTLLAALLFVALPYIPGSEPIVEFFSTMSNLSETSSYQYRVSGWEDEVIPAMLSNPFGHGTGIAKDGVGLFTSHNLYFKLVLENGIFALAAYVLLIGVSLAKCIQNIAKTQSPFIRTFNQFAFSMIVTMSLISVSGPMLDTYPVNLYFWFILGAVFTIGRIDSGSEQLVGTKEK